MTLNILWWVAFFVFGLALQQALPGTDVLVAGLFLALQERRPFQLAVVLLALILVQEGVGTLDFGTSVLWYLLVITLFSSGAGCSRRKTGCSCCFSAAVSAWRITASSG